MAAGEEGRSEDDTEAVTTAGHQKGSSVESRKSLRVQLGERHFPRSSSIASSPKSAVRGADLIRGLQKVMSMSSWRGGDESAAVDRKIGTDDTSVSRSAAPGKLSGQAGSDTRIARESQGRPAVGSVEGVATLGTERAESSSMLRQTVHPGKPLSFQEELMRAAKSRQSDSRGAAPPPGLAQQGALLPREPAEQEGQQLTPSCSSVAMHTSVAAKAPPPTPLMPPKESLGVCGGAPKAAPPPPPPPLRGGTAVAPGKRTAAGPPPAAPPPPVKGSLRAAKTPQNAAAVPKARSEVSRS